MKPDKEITFFDQVDIVKSLRRIYQKCVRSAMPYGSETWCLRENEIAILRRTEKTII